MKILPVLWNNVIHRKRIENNQYDYSQQRQSLLKSPTVDTFEKSISFTHKRPEDVSPSREPLERLYKHHLTCLCCGREMIDPKEIKHLSNNNLLKCSAPEAIGRLEKYEENMHSVEKEVFAILKKEAKKYPDLDFQQILTKIKPEHEEPLIKTQFGIFKMLEKASENIKPELKQQIKNLINDETELILAGDNQFRRKRFVNKFEDIFKGKKNSATKEHLIRLANKLPTAYEDKNAFIVKYSNYSAEAIGIRLLSYSMCTIEHIHPESKDGENHIFNYMPECMRCNSFRSDRPMIQQLEEHPEMFVNAQKLMDQLIGFANQDKLSKWYIVKIQERVKQESEGLLDLDIRTKLNMSKRMQRELAKMQEEPKTNATGISVDEEMMEIRKLYRMDAEKKKQDKTEKESQVKKNKKERKKELVKQQRIEKIKHKNENNIRR